jgi:hypothetical protein
MKPRQQVIISACAFPAFTFIALNRLANNHPGWAAVWAFAAAMHLWMLVDLIRAAKQESHDTKGPQ